jgi:hypothetical protein
MVGREKDRRSEHRFRTGRGERVRMQKER